MDDRDSKINQLTEEVTKSKKNEQVAKDELTKQIMLFNNDERVRRGNLKIVGIEKTVTAVAGRSSQSAETILVLTWKCTSKLLTPA